MRFLVLITFSVFFIQNVFSQNKRSKWVDSVFNKLSRTEKIGQLISTTYSSELSARNIELIAKLVKENKIGSLRLTHARPTFQVNFVNKIQQLAKVPVLFEAYHQNDLASVIDSTTIFFNQSVLRALENDSLKNELKNEIDRQKKIVGISNDLKTKEKSCIDLSLIQDKKNRDLKLQKLVTQNEFISVSLTDVDRFIPWAIKATKKKSLSISLDQAVKKILTKKYEAHLNRIEKLSTDGLIENLNHPKGLLLKEQIAWAVLKVIDNANEIIPVKKLDDKTFTVITVGAENKNEFTKYLSKYATFNSISIQALADTSNIKLQIKATDFLVIGLFSKSLSEKLSMAHLIDRWKKTHPLVVCHFYPLETGYKKEFPTVFGYDPAKEIQKAAAQKIFTGATVNRLVYQLPEAADMDSRTLDKIEAIANEAITIGATPGCHVLVARHGKVVYEKSIGSFSYDKKNPVTDETLYDLASITKVSATLQAVMHLYEKGLIDIHKKISEYLPELKGSNKEDMIIRDILTHQAGLWPYLPFWEKTVKDSVVYKKYYRHQANDDFPFPVSEKIFAAKFMKDSLWQWIIKAKVRDKPAHAAYDYRYSDMGFYMMQHVVEKTLNLPMEDFLQTTIYKPIGAYTMGYLPLRKFSPTQIAPTEKDTLFRKSVLTGYVHDPGAAMHGGIAGHAGLFSNANDLAKLGQMWLNKGSYGGIQFFKPETIELFTAKQSKDSRRGLGWDKPMPNDKNSPTSLLASPKTFGHTGFTGTSIWVDPEFDLVYVFLSNRVNPKMNNPKLLQANIRPRIQDVIYQSIFNYCK